MPELLWLIAKRLRRSGVITLRWWAAVKQISGSHWGSSVLAVFRQQIIGLFYLPGAIYGHFSALGFELCTFWLWQNLQKTPITYRFSCSLSSFFPFISSRRFVSLRLASSSIKLMNLISQMPVFLLSLPVPFILTHLFLPSRLFLSVSFPPPPSLARSPFSQFMEEFGLQKIVSASHLQNTQARRGNCKSATAVMIIACHPTHPSKHTKNVY